jgi:hypothetical protein
MCKESSRTIERAVTEPFAIRHKAFRPEHLTTATSLNNLPTLLLTQGDHVAAKPLFEHIYETALDPEHPDTAAARSAFAAGGPRRGDGWPKGRARTRDRVRSASAGLPRRRSGL